MPEMRRKGYKRPLQSGQLRKKGKNAHVHKINELTNKELTYSQLEDAAEVSRQKVMNPPPKSGSV